MIIGAHIMLQSRDDKADQAFLKDIMKFSSVDAGENFLIYGLPPAELAVHSSDRNDVHEIFLMSDDIAAFAADMMRRGVACTEPVNRGWGTMAQITLPGGGKLGVYQPHHKRPKAAGASAKAAKKKAPARKAAKKPVKKVAKKITKKAAKKNKAKRR
jgi:hypothetical protein